MTDQTDHAVFEFGGNSYAHSALSDDAKHVLKKLVYSDAKLKQLRNELVVAETARRAYAQAFAKKSAKT